MLLHKLEAALLCQMMNPQFNVVNATQLAKCVDTVLDQNNTSFNLAICQLQMINASLAIQAIDLSQEQDGRESLDVVFQKLHLLVKVKAI